jgi:long-chain acyl-CoA synthetase
LAQGEYISPERLENFYITHPGIGTLFIHGDSTETTLVAIIGVDPEPFAGWASKVLRRPITVSEIESVYKDPSILKALTKDLNRIAEERKLQGFERIKAIHLATEPFTVENELLTPTLKLKRADAAKAFRKEIDSLYQGIKEKNVQVKSKL